MVSTWKIITASLVIFAAGVMTGALSVGIAGSAAKRKVPERRVRTEVVQAVVPALPSAPPATVTASDLPQPNLATPGFPSPGSARLELFRRMDRAMALNPAQRERIGQLVDDTEKRLRELWSPVAPEAQRVVRELRRQIQEEVLTPEQRPAFERFLKAHSNAERSNKKNAAELKGN